MAEVYRNRNLPTKFGDDSSIFNELATVYRYPRWRQPLSRILVNVHIFHVTNAFHIGGATFPQNLMIGQLVKKWQYSLEIQHGGSRHLEFFHSELFIHQRCVLYEGRYNFGQYWSLIIELAKDWLDSKGMVTVFRIKDVGIHPLEFHSF